MVLEISGSCVCLDPATIHFLLDEMVLFTIEWQMIWQVL